MIAAFGLIAAPLAAPLAAQQAPPDAVRLWTIASDQCASVHADAEPWSECGFQSFAMNEAGTRVLTISALGRIQLWDGDGRELKRIDWPDDASGASGYPSGRLLIEGGIGVAVVHYNQVALIRLEDGEILAQAVVPLMVIDALRIAGPNRLYVRGSDRDWALVLREVLLPSGEVRPIPGAEGRTQLDEPGPQIWLTGAAPFTRHDARPEPPSESHWLCHPIADRFCFKQDLPGRFVHYFDLRANAGRSVDVGRTLGQFDAVWFAVAGARPYAVVCGRSPDPHPSRRPCHIRDLMDNRAIYAFEASNLRADGGLDEQGRPEIRLSLFSDEEPRRRQIRVGANGVMRVVDAEGRAGMAPGGGLILPDSAERSLLLDSRGVPVARLPFPSQTCGNGWPEWWGGCRISADGRRWLVPVHGSERGEGYGAEVHRFGLALYAVPSATP